ncbi:caspase family protein [Comamonas sp. NLF-1-9]|uniref:caspase family protein n=1 Tax=Comamonas sp. NLF-1-9 TaxID=2853163 RepID=UPI001C46C446|nr:caspase family protein [Comamonas sp. NLF-1-9]QXL83681.1 caspase family protein [Comamonas sp. NLF-1-9]
MWGDWERAARSIEGPRAPLGSSAYLLDAVQPGPADATGATRWPAPGLLTPQPDGSQYLRVLPVRQMSRDALRDVLRARGDYMDGLLAGATSQLKTNPRLADAPGCDSASPGCLLRRQTHAVSPLRPARRMALVIGLDRYQDLRIPQLANPVSDAQAIARTLGQQMGFEARVLPNAGKAQVLQELNRLIEESGPNDSVALYFAGHGTVVKETGEGYWLPSDARADDPSGWLSNADINRALSAITSRQIAVFADSCYAGTLAQGDALLASAGADAPPDIDRIQRLRAVVVMASGGNEPVADGGRAGHSVFAWSLLRQLDEARGWVAAARIFGAVRSDVERELPQTPVYGVAQAAGHEEGADFLLRASGPTGH